jgi:hypothetical protein
VNIAIAVSDAAQNVADTAEDSLAAGASLGGVSKELQDTAKAVTAAASAGVEPRVIITAAQSTADSVKTIADSGGDPNPILHSAHDTAQAILDASVDGDIADGMAIAEVASEIDKEADNGATSEDMFDSAQQRADVMLDAADEGSASLHMATAAQDLADTIKDSISGGASPAGIASAVDSAALAIEVVADANEGGEELAALAKDQADGVTAVTDNGVDVEDIAKSVQDTANAIIDAAGGGETGKESAVTAHATADVFTAAVESGTTPEEALKAVEDEAATVATNALATATGQAVGVGSGNTSHVVPSSAQSAADAVVGIVENAAHGSRGPSSTGFIAKAATHLADAIKAASAAEPVEAESVSDGVQALEDAVAAVAESEVEDSELSDAIVKIAEILAGAIQGTATANADPVKVSHATSDVADVVSAAAMAGASATDQAAAAQALVEQLGVAAESTDTAEDGAIVDILAHQIDAIKAAANAGAGAHVVASIAQAAANAINATAVLTDTVAIVGATEDLAALLEDLAKSGIASSDLAQSAKESATAIKTAAGVGSVEALAVAAAAQQVAYAVTSVGASGGGMSALVTAAQNEAGSISSNPYVLSASSSGNAAGSASSSDNAVVSLPSTVGSNEDGSITATDPTDLAGAAQTDAASDSSPRALCREGNSSGIDMTVQIVSKSNNEEQIRVLRENLVAAVTSGAIVANVQKAASENGALGEALAQMPRQQPVLAVVQEAAVVELMLPPVVATDQASSDEDSTSTPAHASAGLAREQLAKHAQTAPRGEHAEEMVRQWEEHKQKQQNDTQRMQELKQQAEQWRATAAECESKVQVREQHGQQCEQQREHQHEDEQSNAYSLQCEAGVDGSNVAPMASEPEKSSSPQPPSRQALVETQMTTPTAAADGEDETAILPLTADRGTAERGAASEGGTVKDAPATEGGTSATPMQVLTSLRTSELDGTPAKANLTPIQVLASLRSGGLNGTPTKAIDSMNILSTIVSPNSRTITTSAADGSTARICLNDDGSVTTERIPPKKKLKPKKLVVDGITPQRLEADPKEARYEEEKRGNQPQEGQELKSAQDQELDAAAAVIEAATSTGSSDAAEAAGIEWWRVNDLEQQLSEARGQWQSAAQALEELRGGDSSNDAGADTPPTSTAAAATSTTKQVQSAEEAIAKAERGSSARVQQLVDQLYQAKQELSGLLQQQQQQQHQQQQHHHQQHHHRHRGHLHHRLWLWLRLPSRRWGLRKQTLGRATPTLRS